MELKAGLDCKLDRIILRPRSVLWKTQLILLPKGVTKLVMIWRRAGNEFLEKLLALIAFVALKTNPGRIIKRTLHLRLDVI
jgi:hypothetical protein